MSEEVKKSNFRQDLYFRLKTINIHVPSLKDHLSDLSQFIERFGLEFTAKNDIAFKGFSSEALTVMKRYDWPGNVRELRNLIERVTILSQGKDENRILNIIKESLTQSQSNKFSLNETLDYPLREARENFEKEYLITQLKKFSGNISKTARFVGMERSALHRKLKLLGVKDLN